MLPDFSSFAATETITKAESLPSNGGISIGGGLMTALIGMVVVFAVLLILIFCIQALHVFFKDRMPRKQEPAAPAEAKQENTQRISAGVMAVAPEAEQAPDDPEFLAAVSACISAVIGKPNGSFTITSIKKGE